MLSGSTFKNGWLTCRSNWWMFVESRAFDFKEARQKNRIKLWISISRVTATHRNHFRNVDWPDVRTWIDSRSQGGISDMLVDYLWLEGMHNVAYAKPTPSRLLQATRNDSATTWPAFPALSLCPCRWQVLLCDRSSACCRKLYPAQSLFTDYLTIWIWHSRCEAISKSDPIKELWRNLCRTIQIDLPFFVFQVCSWCREL